MDVVLGKKVNDLRRKILECFDYSRNQNKSNNEDLGQEIEVMDSIISSLSSLDIMADAAEAELDDDTDTQYQLIDSMSNKQETLDLALKLKKEIVEKLYSDRKDLLKTHEDIAVDVTLEEDDDVFESMISVLNYVDSKINSLKNLLYMNVDVTFENFKKFVDSFEKFYDGFYDVYNSSIHDNSLESEISDIIEISEIDINFLKTLQLNFIISDCISDKLYNGNSELRKKLDENPNIISIIMRDKNLLKIFFQYYKKNLDMLEHDLNSEDKKRIKKLNKFTIFDV